MTLLLTVSILISLLTVQFHTIQCYLALPSGARSPTFLCSPNRTKDSLRFFSQKLFDASILTMHQREQAICISAKIHQFKKMFHNYQKIDQENYLLQKDITSPCKCIMTFGQFLHFAFIMLAGSSGPEDWDVIDQNPCPLIN